MNVSMARVEFYLSSSYFREILLATSPVSVLEQWFPLKSEQAHFLYFVIQLSPPFILASCCYFCFVFYERTISGVDLIEMTLKVSNRCTLSSMVTFQAFRRLTIMYVQSTIVPL